ncbi:Hsp70 family protein [Phytomonospora sp. NPDC050363]|uniref:Hsp70 family protein n=1 Tax=Phytomonospora sp. NPDC050363 TaxID=3155642 RepID=UPI0033D5D529
MRLGIDYGTSHTVAVLAWPDGRRRPLHFGASALLSSAVHAGAGGLLQTGQDALRAGLGDPAGLEPNPKRRIDYGEVLLGETSYPVADLMAATLRTVWDEAVRVAGRPPSDVMLTHPADWGQARRGLLADAARRAGIPSPAYLPEPVAAATFFVAEAGVEVPVGAHAVVYDLGAGTFDVSLVRRTAGGFEVLASGGLGDVGGLDLDRVIVDRVGLSSSGIIPAVWRRLVKPVGPVDLRAQHALWTEARNAKETLSRQTSATLFVPLLDRDSLVTREEFERDAMPILERTASTMTAIVARAGVAWSQVAAVFLVGGSSRVPLAATLVHRACGIAPTVVEQPELVVAEGAVLAAAKPKAPKKTAPRRSVPAAPPPRPLPPALARILDAAVETVRPGDSYKLGGPRTDLLALLAATDPARALRLADMIGGDFELEEGITQLAAESPRAAAGFAASLAEGSVQKPLCLVHAARGAAGVDPGRSARMLFAAVSAAEAVPTGIAKAIASIEPAHELLAAADHGYAERVAAVDPSVMGPLSRALASRGLADRSAAMRLFDEAEQVVRASPEDEEMGRVMPRLAALLSAFDPARGEELARVLPSKSRRRSACVASACAMGVLDPVRAERLLVEAEGQILALRKNSKRAHALGELIPAWALLDPGRAEALLRGMPPEPGFRLEWATRRLVTRLASTDPARAERLALSLPAGLEDDRDDVLADLVEALAPHDLTRAEGLLGAFTEDYNREQAVTALARSLVSTDRDRAERIAGLVPRDDLGSIAAVAQALIPVDHRRGERVLRSIPPDPESDWWELGGAIKELAAIDPHAAERVALHIPSGNRARAVEHAVVALAPKDPERAERLMRANLDTHQDEMVHGLVALGRVHAARGGGILAQVLRRGQRLFDEAERVARGIRGISAARMLADVAVAVAGFDRDRARRLLDEAETACAAIETKYSDYRYRSTVDLVKAWTPLDVDRAERVARSIPDTHRAERAKALLAIARHLHPLP